MPQREAFVIELSPNWKFVEAALISEVMPIMREEQLLLTRGAALEMRLLAQRNLDTMVYEAPLPPSAFTTWGGPERYLERSRIGRTRGAVKSEVVLLGEETVARAYVDRTDYPAFLYALSLEYGMMNRFPSYYPRPFWRMAKLVLQASYRAEGRLAARRITTRIHGRFV